MAPGTRLVPPNQIPENEEDQEIAFQQRSKRFIGGNGVIMSSCSTSNTPENDMSV